MQKSDFKTKAFHIFQIVAENRFKKSILVTASLKRGRDGGHPCLWLASSLTFRLSAHKAG